MNISNISDVMNKVKMGMNLVNGGFTVNQLVQLGLTQSGILQESNVTRVLEALGELGNAKAKDVDLAVIARAVLNKPELLELAKSLVEEARSQRANLESSKPLYANECVECPECKSMFYLHFQPNLVR